MDGSVSYILSTQYTDQKISESTSQLPAKDIKIVDINNNFTHDNVEDVLNELFQSVSNGKTLIASAITDKGVNTSNNDTFKKMADNILGLLTSEGISFLKVLNLAMERNSSLQHKVDDAQTDEDKLNILLNCIPILKELSDMLSKNDFINNLESKISDSNTVLLLKDIENTDYSDEIIKTYMINFNSHVNDDVTCELK